MSEPVCPECGSNARRSTTDHFDRWEFECGAWANVENFAEHGEGALVDYEATCDYRNEIARLRAALQEITKTHSKEWKAGQIAREALEIEFYA